MKRIIASTIACLALALPSTASASTKLPPAWRTWLEVCAREQPKPGRFDVTKWSTPNWTHSGPGVTYPGGCGMTRDNYADIRLDSWPLTMDKASPVIQLWACHRLFWKHARIGQQLHGGDYAAGQRYGSTVWDVHHDMNWHGFLRDGVTWQ